MRVGILGLGLIGGSLARAYTKAGHTVYAADNDQNIIAFAQLAEVIDAPLDETTIPNCDLILLAVYTTGCMNWMDQHAPLIHKTAFVIDCCGVKEHICKHCFALANKFGFTYIGGHPMAGSHNAGFKYSRSNLFQGAPMVLVPPRFDDPELLERAKNALAPCKFGSFSITTAAEHDKLIAFTSQMPHIVSNAYIKSPTAQDHKGFSAGSYKDLTRVAWLNPNMWAELFLTNQSNVLHELNLYIDSLCEYRDAIANCDSKKLIQLLDEGRKCKEEVDG